jgi:hypothetical protein
MIIAHLDPVGGISGDMFLGAILDAGVPVDDLRAAIAGVLHLGAWLDAERVDVHGTPATQCRVTITARDAHERSLADVEAILRAAQLHEDDAARALRVFRRLAAAEAHVHQADETRVHFHEVGALDAIVDIAGTVAGLRLLRVERITAGPLPIGHGTIRSAHGVLPNPAPATQQMLSGLAVKLVDVASELVTPTGAALVAELTESMDEAPSFRVRRTGVGAGSRRIEGWPNVARLIVGEAAAPQEHVEIVTVRTTVDHVSGEIVGYVCDLLLERGALDVFATPVQMKKSRPGVMITVLCPVARWRELTDTLLVETGSLGARVMRERRVVIDRRVVSVHTPWGIARVKVADAGAPRAVPEYEDARRIARASGQPLRRVLEMIVSTYEAHHQGR